MNRNLYLHLHLDVTTVHPVAQDNLNHTSIICTSDWSPGFIMMILKYTIFFFYILLHYPHLHLIISPGMFLGLPGASTPPGFTYLPPPRGFLDKEKTLDLSATFTQNSSTAPHGWHGTLCASWSGSVKIARPIKEWGVPPTQMFKRFLVCPQVE